MGGEKISQFLITILLKNYLSLPYDSSDKVGTDESISDKSDEDENRTL